MALKMIDTFYDEERTNNICAQLWIHLCLPLKSFLKINIG